MTLEALNQINAITLPVIYRDFALKKSYGFQQPIFLIVVIKKQIPELTYSKEHKQN